MKLLVGLFFVVIALILLGVLLISRDVFQTNRATVLKTTGRSLWRWM